MRNEKEIIGIYDLFNRINDNSIFNQDFRRGFLYALEFVLYEEKTRIDKIIEIFEEFSKTKKVNKK